jgi:hypothetical protein
MENFFSLLPAFEFIQIFFKGSPSANTEISRASKLKLTAKKRKKLLLACFSVSLKAHEMGILNEISFLATT